MTVTFSEAPALPDWLAQQFPFTRRMARVGEHSIHFVDQGEGAPVLLFHGNPTWSFLWRKVIHALAGEARIIAPDLVGLGLSDKPRRPSAHQLEMHVGVMCELVAALELDSIVVAGQDWGGPVGMGVASRFRGTVAGVLLSNTAVLKPARPFRPKAFHKFSHQPIVSDLAFRLGGFPLPIMPKVQGDPSSIGPLEKKAYRYPLRRVIDRAAPLGLARMVPNAESHPSTPTLDAIGGWVESYEGPVELVWGTKDPILGGALGRHARALPQARITETDAGHFLQEEVPEPIAAAISRLIA
jgi:cis-3-alkyl-4-acyloxetan-2-one decarboxylase